jgi:hypothetical protein
VFKWCVRHIDENKINSWHTCDIMKHPKEAIPTIYYPQEHKLLAIQLDKALSTQQAQENLAKIDRMIAQAVETKVTKSAMEDKHMEIKSIPGIKVSKLIEVDVPQKFIYIEEMRNGEFRLTYTKNLSTILTKIMIE